MTQQLLIDAGPGGLLLALLLAGHVAGDFLLQTGAMVARKGSNLSWLLLHAGVVTAAHAVLLLPFLSFECIPLLLFLGAGHVLFDRLKSNARGDRLRWFGLDQGLHLAVLLGVWGIWLAWLGAEPWLEMSRDTVQVLTAAAVVGAAYVFNGQGGSAVVGGLLSRYQFAITRSPEEMGKEMSRGRVIGVLERMIVLSLVLTDQWGALGLVFAGKSIARFRDLESRAFCEYYLIGTLSSMLVAIASGLLVRVLV